MTLTICYCECHKGQLVAVYDNEDYCELCCTTQRAEQDARTVFNQVRDAEMMQEREEESEQSSSTG